MSAAPTSTVTVDGGRRVPEPAPWSAFHYNDHSFVLVDVTPPDGAGTTTLTVRAVNAGGTEIERFTLLRRHDRCPCLPAGPDQGERGTVAA
jgi:hypothetical protein